MLIVRFTFPSESPSLTSGQPAPFNKGARAGSQEKRGECIPDKGSQGVRVAYLLQNTEIEAILSGLDFVNTKYR